MNTDNFTTYCVDPTADEPIMLINTHIGFDAEDGMGIDGKLFQEELLRLDGMGKKRIQVWINSPGGVVLDGYNIFSAIMDSKTPVDTYVKGMAASIAGPIFMAGRMRYMTDYSSLMMHNPFGGDDEKQLGVMKDSIATMIAGKSKLEMSHINFLMDKTTWLNPAECLDHGFCNEIEVTSQGNKKWATEPKTEWKNSNLILNNILKIETMENKLSAIINYLKIDAAATESIVLTEVQNRITAAQGEATQAKADLANINNKYNALVLKNEADALEAQNKLIEAENATKTLKAKNMVEGFVKLGKIRPEAVAKWLPLAIENFAGIENLLKELPINKVGYKIENKNQEKPVAGYTIVERMAEISARNKQ